MSESIEQRIEAFISWYKTEKNRIWSLAYFNFGGFFQELTNPFRSWTKSHYISVETDMTEKAIAKLNELFPSPNSSDLSRLESIYLTAKNRAETISWKSDFYPVYSALVGAGLGVFSLGLTHPFNVIAAVLAFILILTSATIRLKTRAQTANLKEISNLLEHFCKAHRVRSN